MMAQRSHGSISRGIKVAAPCEISAHRASNAADFSGYRRRQDFFTVLRGTPIHSRPSWVRTPDAFGVSLHFGFAAERGRLCKKKIQDEDGFVITTRPPKRGRSRGLHQRPLSVEHSQDLNQLFLREVLANTLELS